MTVFVREDPHGGHATGIDLRLDHVAVNPDRPASGAGTFGGIRAIMATVGRPGAVQIPTMRPNVGSETAGLLAAPLMDDVHHIDLAIAVLIVGREIEARVIRRAHRLVNQIARPLIFHDAGPDIGPIIIMTLRCLIPTRDTPWPGGYREPAIRRFRVVVPHAVNAGPEQQRVELGAAIGRGPVAEIDQNRQHVGGATQGDAGLGRSGPNGLKGFRGFARHLGRGSEPRRDACRGSILPYRGQRFHQLARIVTHRIDPVPRCLVAQDRVTLGGFPAVVPFVTPLSGIEGPTVRLSQGMCGGSRGDRERRGGE